jgi:E3 ubiquitin-protein ligase NEDD4
MGGMAALTSVTGEGGGGAVRMNSEVQQRNTELIQSEIEQIERQLQNRQTNGTAPAAPPAPPTTYMVTVPRGIRQGMQFAVDVEGQRMMVTCPANVQAGMNLRIQTQQQQQQQQQSSLNSSGGTISTNSSSSSMPPMQMFEVIVPSGVQPGQSFSLLANGQRVLVTCPPNIRPGQAVRFNLPIADKSQQMSASSPAKKLEYADIPDGWARTIRVTDMKFQWTRHDGDKDSPVDTQSTTATTIFDIKNSAYTRKLRFLEGNDPRMRTGVLELVPADQASVDSTVQKNGKQIVGYAEIAAAHDKKKFEDKAEWFQMICRERLRIEWSDGHMKMKVRRTHLLHDSIEAVMSLGPTDMRKIWRFEFLGEAGIDAGGLAREWFELVTEQLFDPDMGLWLPSASNQMAMRINPASEISCPENHLIYFRFLGRVMGKALFDGQIVAGHMVRHLYKHILGWPVTFEDLEIPDESYYNSLKSLMDLDNIEDMCLDFTFLENDLGENRSVDLIENGSDITVTNENLPQFLEANMKYHMMDRVKRQLTELLLGFFDVIPEPLLTIFDFQELELLMCGLPKIDIDDWMANTNYQGYFEQSGKNAKTVKWFWEIVSDEFDHEQRARLLQFSTGTSGVPSRGFSVLQSNDGKIRKFCINGIKKDISLYPRSHTCFNRIDLPIYNSKDELREKLKVAIESSATGFDIE